MKYGGVAMKIVELPMSVDNILSYARLNMPGYDEIEERLSCILTNAEGIVKDMCLSLLSSGGKRVRPLLVVYSGLCFSEISQQVIYTAVASELIHMASLVHDDIIDLSESRRGRRTINSVYGNHSAVLAGDYLFAQAFSILSHHKLLSSMEYLVEAISQMCDGEINQAGDGFKLWISEDEYFNRIRKKTGILISSCCRAGSSSAGAPDHLVNAMGDYGMNVGYAYQIVDDILDFTGDEGKLGKPTGMDLINGNITLPVIMLLKHEEYRDKALRIIRQESMSHSDVNTITGMLKKSGAIDMAYDTAHKCIIRAKDSISRVRDSAYKSMLLYMADRAVSRDS